jgi:hypothetical protein
MKLWGLIKLHAKHALMYKPYRFHDTIIISNDKDIHYLKSLSLKGFIQHYHFIARDKKSGTCISSYDKAFHSKEKFICHIHEPRKKG